MRRLHPVLQTAGRGVDRQARVRLVHALRKWRLRDLRHTSAGMPEFRLWLAAAPGTGREMEAVPLQVCPLVGGPKAEGGGGTFAAGCLAQGAFLFVFQELDTAERG